MIITRIRHRSKRGSLLVHHDTPTYEDNFRVIKEGEGIRLEYHTTRHKWGVELTEAEFQAIIARLTLKPN
jgi:hypothetical protein